jgi:photosystem II stability/assembly factor-like uncharacterized protein
MRPLALISIALALVGAILGYFAFSPKLWQRGEAEEKEAGPFPSNWFMLQRLWPDREISVDDYLSAHNAAAAFRRTSLDDQPPWVAAGPNNIGGRMTDIVGHPTNSQLFYVAAASGGIFKTTNGGTDWTPIFDSAPGLSMGAMAIDLSHPDTIYAGTGESNSAGYSYFGSGVYKTTDGGTSWAHLGLTETRYISRIVVDPDNPLSVWVAALGELFVTSNERGIYHSSDGGTTWNQKYFVNDSTGASDVVVNPDNPQIVYAAMWQRIRNTEWRDVGGFGSRIARSTDGGETWATLTDGLPPAGENIGRIGLAISPSNTYILYAIYADDPGYFAGIFRTSDGGNTWGRTNDASISGLYSSFGWYFGNIRVRPDNSNIVFALGQGLARTTDGGQTWNYNGSNVHVDHHAMWFHPAQPTTILLGNDGGMYRTTNNGNTWAFLPGLPVNQFYAASVDAQLPNRRYGGTQDNGTLRTLTGGLNDWDMIYGGDGFYALVDPTNSNRIYAEYQYGYLGRSDNGGASFNDATNGIDFNERRNWSTPVAMSPSSPNTLYYGAERVYRTTDMGNNWSAISPDLTDGGGGGNLVFGTVTTIAASPANSQVIYAGTDDANVWVSVNNGASWQNRSAGLPNRWITRVAPDPHVASAVYVTISGYRNNEQDAHLFYSDDYGVTWQNISSDLPVGPLNDVVPDPDIAQRLYVASDFGTYVTTDRGGHWIALGENLPAVPVIQLVLHNATRVLTAATYGRSMYTLDLSLLTLNRPPVITSFTPANLDTIVAPQTLLFSVVASDPDSNPLSYVWTRNGDTVSTSPSVELQFADTNVTEHVIVAVSDSELTTQHAWTFYVASAVSAEDQPSPIPLSFAVSAYPNPFNSTATITYSLPRAGHVELSVYDLTGRKVATLLNGNLPAGQASISWSANALPSGTYFLHFNSAAETKIRKVLLVR